MSRSRPVYLSSNLIGSDLLFISRGLCGGRSTTALWRSWPFWSMGGVGKCLQVQISQFLTVIRAEGDGSVNILISYIWFFLRKEISSLSYRPRATSQCHKNHCQMITIFCFCFSFFYKFTSQYISVGFSVFLWDFVVIKCRPE